MDDIFTLSSVDLNKTPILHTNINFGTTQQTPVTIRGYYSEWFKFETNQALEARNFNGVAQNYTPDNNPIYTYWIRLWGILRGDSNYENIKVPTSIKNDNDNPILLLSKLLNFDIVSKYNKFGVIIDHNKQGGDFVTYPNMPNWNELDNAKPAPGYFGLLEAKYENVSLLVDGQSKTVTVHNTSNFSSTNTHSGTAPEPPSYLVTSSSLIYNSSIKDIVSLTSKIQLYSSKDRNMLTGDYAVGTNELGVSLFFNPASGEHPILEVMVGAKQWIQS